MIFDKWNGSIKNWDTLLNELNDETLLKEIVPGKNRGIYLLGHLIAVHDEVMILLDLGQKLYPELYETFLKCADKEIIQIPSASQLREYWSKQCDTLNQKFSKLKTEEWFEKHSAISTDDFAKEPHRNKLNVILTRATHVVYHTGQLMLLK